MDFVRHYIIFCMNICASCFIPDDSYFNMISDSQVYMVEVGANLVLECNFHADKYDMFARPVIWRKVQLDEEVHINALSNINPPFKQQNRFEVVFTNNISRFQMALVIKNSRQEDSGNYTCEIKGENSLVVTSVTHQLLVRDSVKSVVLSIHPASHQNNLHSNPITNPNGDFINKYSNNMLPDYSVRNKDNSKILLENKDIAFSNRKGKKRNSKGYIKHNDDKFGKKLKKPFKDTALNDVVKGSYSEERKLDNINYISSENKDKSNIFRRRSYPTKKKNNSNRISTYSLINKKIVYNQIPDQNLNVTKNEFSMKDIHHLASNINSRHNYNRIKNQYSQPINYSNVKKLNYLRNKNINKQQDGLYVDKNNFYNFHSSKSIYNNISNVRIKRNIYGINKKKIKDKKIYSNDGNIDNYYRDNHQNYVSINNYKSKQSTTFIENKPYVVRCLVRGGSPHPAVRIYVGRRDLSSVFQTNLNIEKKGVKGLRLLEPTFELYSNVFRFNQSNDAKDLNCIASIQGMNTFMDSIKINLFFQPDITCRNTEAQMNERNVKVFCEVKSKPDLTNHFWLLDDGKTVLHSGSVQDGYWSVYNERSEGVSEIMLNTLVAETRTFRKYTLVAENIIGKSLKEVEIVLYSKSQSDDARKTDDNPFYKTKYNKITFESSNDETNNNFNYEAQKNIHENEKDHLNVLENNQNNKFINRGFHSKNNTTYNRKNLFSKSSNKQNKKKPLPYLSSSSTTISTSSFFYISLFFYFLHHEKIHYSVLSSSSPSLLFAFLSFPFPSSTLLHYLSNILFLLYHFFFYM